VIVKDKQEMHIRTKRITFRDWDVVGVVIRCRATYYNFSKLSDKLEFRIRLELKQLHQNLIDATSVIIHSWKVLI